MSWDCHHPFIQYIILWDWISTEQTCMNSAYCNSGHYGIYLVNEHITKLCWSHARNLVGDAYKYGLQYIVCLQTSSMHTCMCVVWPSLYLFCILIYFPVFELHMDIRTHTLTCMHYIWIVCVHIASHPQIQIILYLEHVNTRCWNGQYVVIVADRIWSHEQWNNYGDYERE